MNTLSMNTINPDRMATMLLAVVGEGLRRLWEEGDARVCEWDYRTGQDIRLLSPDMADMMAGMKVTGIEDKPNTTKPDGCLISLTRNGEDETIIHMTDRSIVDAITKILPINPVNY